MTQRKSSKTTDMVTYNNTIGGLEYQDSTNHKIELNYDYCWNRYCSMYSGITIIEDKIGKAFKIVSKLIEKKYLEKINIKKFIEIVNEIAQVM
jgi:hypothetical protein